MSDLILRDEEIGELIGMPKRVTNNPRWTILKKSKRKNYTVESIDGRHQFMLYLRQNERVLDHFSCGLVYQHPDGESVHLVRHNGSDHEHDNPLEGGPKLKPSCHIHLATERYMLAGRKPEHYAVATTRYIDLDGALRTLLDDCNIQGMPTEHPRLF